MENTKRYWTLSEEERKQAEEELSQAKTYHEYCVIMEGWSDEKKLGYANMAGITDKRTKAYRQSLLSACDVIKKDWRKLSDSAKEARLHIVQKKAIADRASLMLFDGNGHMINIPVGDEEGDGYTYFSTASSYKDVPSYYENILSISGSWTVSMNDCNPYGGPQISGDFIVYRYRNKFVLAWL